VTAEELIMKAAACQDCGKEHHYIRTGELSASWAAADGHSYRPVIDADIVARLRGLATGVYRSPWIPEKRKLLSRRGGQP
jgi:hypothetical protein